MVSLNNTPLTPILLQPIILLAHFYVVLHWHPDETSDWLIDWLFNVSLQVHKTCEYILIKNIYFIFIEYKMCSYWMCFVCPTVLGLPDCRTIGTSDERSDRKRKYKFQLFLFSLLNNTIIKRTFLWTWKSRPLW